MLVLALLCSSIIVTIVVLAFHSFVFSFVVGMRLWFHIFITLLRVKIWNNCNCWSERGNTFSDSIMEIQTSGRPIESLLEKVLCMNILSSDYFKELYRLKTYHEVIDEIYNQVDHVEPWMTGNCRGPSTAFCLLYKFFTMKLTVKQMHGLLKHPDSPYIRAVCRGL